MHEFFCFTVNTISIKIFTSLAYRYNSINSAQIEPNYNNSYNHKAWLQKYGNDSPCLATNEIAFV